MTDSTITIPQAFETAVQHHQAGRLAEAEAIYRRILTIEPDYFNALHLLGVIAHQRGKHREAIGLIDRATKQDASAYPAFNNLGLAYQALNELDAAGNCYRRALALRPDYTDAQSNLAIVLHAQGDFEGAVVRFQEVLTARPDFVEAHNNLGNAFHAQGNLGEAAACYQKALSLNPEYVEAHFNLAKVFEVQGRSAEALAGYQEAVLLKPDLAEAHFCLGVMLQVQGLIDDALDCFRTALSLKPDFAEAHWTLAMSQLALVHREEDVPEKFRTAFSQALTGLDRWFDAERTKDGFKAVGSQQPYYLAYHELDNRDLLSQYGDLCARLMRHWQEDQGLAFHSCGASGTVRVGIVSAHIYNQSVWSAIIKGWFQHLDRSRFSIHVFYLGTTQDRETAFAKSLATSFVEGFRGFPEWVDTILGEELDVILYPEIGMNPMTVKLASLRLAPVQVAAWGHPETTGLPTIDYYLSASDFEPTDAQANYRERLVALPHLGCCYQALDVTATDLDLESLGIASDLPLLICPGTPFKYAPDHDWIFVEIAKSLGRCQFIFFNHLLENLSEQLQQRLEGAFANADLYFDEHAVFISWLNRPAFYGLLHRADVYLDTIGFSGFNTAMQAIECDLPIVTREGRFMRGRLASGILKRMGMSELVAESEQRYVETVVKLARDPGYRQQVRERIKASRHVLFDDVSSIRALEEFLNSATKNTNAA